ncbi:MAG: hypothetical protein J6T01_01115, partial [Kiritimatiellae bacterium]|nr:hypothetical protein [Kiritimatiellia bacterium]
MTGGKNWREFAWEAAAALAFCGALQWFARNLLWKLADSTFVLADWDGFREVAFAHAFGAVDWVARYLCAMTLAPGGFAATTALLLLAMTAAFAVRGV